MTTRTILIAASVAANAVLLSFALRAPDHAPSADHTAVSERGDSATTAPVSAAGTRTDHPAAPAWTRIDTQDPRELMERLVAAGFPRRIASAVAMDQIDAKYDAAIAAILGDETKLPYWCMRHPRYTPKTRSELHTMLGENAEQRHAIVAEIFLDSEEARVFWAVETGIADPAKQKRIYDIQHDFMGVMHMSAAMNTGPDAKPVSRQATQLARQEQLADIREALTPEEFAAYQLRQSPIADRVRRAAGKFCTTEDDYRALYAACETVAAPASTENLTPRVTDEQLLAEARAILPPERFADLQQSLAPGAGKLNRLVTRLGLPLAAGAPVHAAQRELKERASVVQRDPTLTAEQRSQALAALADEAARRITTALGPQGFTAYREYDGAWIDALSHPEHAPGL